MQILLLYRVLLMFKIHMEHTHIHTHNKSVYKSTKFWIKFLFSAAVEQIDTKCTNKPFFGLVQKGETFAETLSAITCCKFVSADVFSILMLAVFVSIILWILKIYFYAFCFVFFAAFYEYILKYMGNSNHVFTCRWFFWHSLKEPWFQNRGLARARIRWGTFCQLVFSIRKVVLKNN